METTPPLRSIVVDVDGTLCFTANRDYANATPNQPLIAVLNRLYDAGVAITLYTARGMVSCHGNLEVIHQTVRPTLEAWLAKHGVKYHHLVMGKPHADLYIDDKACTPEDFYVANHC